MTPARQAWFTENERIPISYTVYDELGCGNFCHSLANKEWQLLTWEQGATPSIVGIAGGQVGRWNDWSTALALRVSQSYLLGLVRSTAFWQEPLHYVWIYEYVFSTRPENIAPCCIKQQLICRLVKHGVQFNISNTSMLPEWLDIDIQGQGCW